MLICDKCDYRRAARLNLFNITESFFKKFILRRNGKHGSPLFDKRYGAVLELTGGIGLRMNLRYFLEL